MKIVLRAAAYCCGGVMGAADAPLDGGLPHGTRFLLLLICFGCGVFFVLPQPAVLLPFEEAEKKAVQRSARKAAFFREVDKL